MNPLRRDVNEVLLGILGSEEFVQRWWTSDNAAFGFVPPQYVWDQGDEAQIEVANYVFTHGFK